MSGLTKHFMIDIETFDTRQGGIIDQIGWVYFDKKEIRKTGKIILPAFPALAAGFTWSEKTDEWREKQGMKTLAESVFNSISSMNVDIYDPLMKLHAYIRDVKPDWFWQKGQMDIAMLDRYYRLFCAKLDGICEYWRVNDVRTVMRAYNYIDNRKTTHDAESDALNQTQALLDIWKLHGYNYSEPLPF